MPTYWLQLTLTQTVLVLKFVNQMVHTSTFLVTKLVLSSPNISSKLTKQLVLSLLMLPFVNQSYQLNWLLRLQKATAQQCLTSWLASNLSVKRFMNLKHSTITLTCLVLKKASVTSSNHLYVIKTLSKPFLLLRKLLHTTVHVVWHWQMVSKKSTNNMVTSQKRQFQLRFQVLMVLQKSRKSWTNSVAMLLNNSTTLILLKQKTSWNKQLLLLTA